MKRLPTPTYDDADISRKLANNTRLASYPLLHNNRAAILTQYTNYTACGGDPWVVAPLTLDAGLLQALQTHYERPPKDLALLSEMRDVGSPDVCPMCGSLHTGTLDHVLPKGIYPEFSVFTRNLVPACICNSKRSTTHKGLSAGERVLHPYFDDVLTDRLISCELTGHLETPAIQLRLVCGNIPKRSAVRFHMDNIVQRTQIIAWLERKWAALVRQPAKMLPGADVAGVDENALEHIVADILDQKDYELGTPNNWYSIFFSGLLRSHGVIPFLLHKVTGGGNGGVV